MKKTLLQIVQAYLDRTDGWYVNSIFESDESQQVASIAEDVLYRVYSVYRNSEFAQKLRTLDAVSDPDRPNYLRIPDEIQRIQDSKVYYDVRKAEDNVISDYRCLEYLTPEEFLLHVGYTLKDSEDNYILVEDFNRTKFPVRTDKAPSVYTSFDGEYIVFDSFNSEQDTTLQESKSRVFSSEEPEFIVQNDTIIPLPNRLVGMYQDLVLVECYETLRQEPAPPSIARRARAAWLKFQQDSRRIGNTGRKPTNYGRKVHGLQTRRNR